jgi:hypothetical protein
MRIAMKQLVHDLVDSQTILQELLHRQNHSDDMLFGMSSWSKFATHIG